MLARRGRLPSCWLQKAPMLCPLGTAALFLQRPLGELGLGRLPACARRRTVTSLTWRIDSLFPVLALGEVSPRYRRFSPSASLYLIATGVPSPRRAACLRSHLGRNTARHAVASRRKWCGSAPPGMILWITLPSLWFTISVEIGSCAMLPRMTIYLYRVLRCGLHFGLFLLQPLRHRHR